VQAGASAKSKIQKIQFIPDYQPKSFGLTRVMLILERQISGKILDLVTHRLRSKFQYTS